MGPGEEFRYGFQFLEMPVFLSRGAHDLMRVTEPSGAVTRKRGWGGGKGGGVQRGGSVSGRSEQSQDPFCRESQPHVLTDETCCVGAEEKSNSSVSI